MDDLPIPGLGGPSPAKLRAMRAAEEARAAAERAAANGDLAARINALRTAGRSWSSIAGELAAEIQRGKPSAADMEARITEMRTAGRSWGEIARELTGGSSE
jgi:hypothetical protein